MSNLPVPVDTRSLRVVACPNPFKQARDEYRLVPGLSLWEILQEVQPDISAYSALVWVNDDPVPSWAWDSTFPLAGSHIFIKAIPQGPVGKVIGSIFVAIAAIAAALLAPWALGLTGVMAGLVGGLAGLTVGIVGNLALNALFPPVSPQALEGSLGVNSSQSSQSSLPSFTLTSSSNQARKWGPVGKVLGRILVYPDKGAREYTEVVGKDQFLRVVFVWGISRSDGPGVQIEDLRIGQTPVGNFPDLEMEHRNLQHKDTDGNITVHGDGPLTLYPLAILETALSIELLKNEEAIETSQINADELSVQITCPNGLQAVSQSGNTSNYTVVFNVFYRETGTSGSWLAPSGSDDSGVFVGNVITLTANTRSAVRGGLRWKLPARGQYDVKAIRMSPGPDDIYHQSISYWTALRTIRNEDPLNFPVPMAVTAMRIKASGRLTGTVDLFNAICTSICPDWDAATETWITQATQNPASLSREWMQGEHKQDPYPDEEMDLEKWAYFHEYCETQGWKYNKRIEADADWWGTLTEILAAARASRTWLDGKLSVIIDEVQEFTQGPAFTPRNSRNYSFQITYPEKVHAWRIPFKNELQNFQDDERIVPDDGYQIDGLDAWGDSHPEYPAATIFKQLPLQGITDPELVFRHGRYHIAQARLRFITHSFDAHIEQTVATRGDRIKFAQDVILAGMAQGRVKDLILEEIEGEPTGNLAGVTVDEPCPMQEGVDYSIRFVLEGHAALLCPVVNTPGLENYTLTFVTLIPPYDPGPPPENLRPQVGNIFMFGESGKEAIDLIQKSVRPNSTMGARIEAVAYNEAINTADQGTIPEHVPQTTAPPDWWSPVISDIRSDGSVLYRAPDGSLESRILITLNRLCALDNQITGVEAQYWPTGGQPAPVVLPVMDIDAGEVSIMPVEDGRSYDFRLRYVKQDGSRGPWCDTETHVVEGKTAPPEDITGLVIYQIQNMVNMSCNSNPDKDIGGYYFAFGPVGCTKAEAAIISIVGAPRDNDNSPISYSTPLVPPGTWDFLCWARDTLGNDSENVTRKQFKVVQFYQVISAVSQAPLWGGTLTNMIRDPRTGWLYPKSQDSAAGNDNNWIDYFCHNPYSECIYEAPEIDLLEDKSGRLWSRIYSELGPGESGTNAPALEVDYRTEGGAYDGFEEITIGAFAGRYIKQRVKFDPSVTGGLVLKGFQPVVDKAL